MATVLANKLITVGKFLSTDRQRDIDKNLYRAEI